MAVLYGKIEARQAIQELYNDNLNSELDSELKKVAKKYRVDVDLVRQYYDLISKGTSSRAVIFFNYEHWLFGQPCFDFRVEVRVLPTGSIVVGMVFENGSGFIIPPALEQSQVDQFKEICRKVLNAVGLFDHEWVNGPDNAGSPTLVPKCPESV
jgi:hypothetical protein